MAPPLSSLYTLSFFLALLSTLVLAATLRLLAILPSAHRTPQPWRKPPPTTHLLVVLGSGGHTHEMLSLLKDLDPKKYTHRTYVVSTGDAFSAQRAVDFEKALEDRQQQQQQHTHSAKGKEYKDKTTINTGPKHYTISLLPRARKIHQPLLTTPFSSLLTLYHALISTLLSSPLHPNTDTDTDTDMDIDLPDLILTNGPATGVIIVLASLLLKFFNVRGAHSRRKCRTLYVESFARVKGLSLSGRMVVRVVDRFLVQWEGLEGVGGGRAEYRGVLV